MTGLGASKLPKLPPKQHEQDLPKPPKLLQKDYEDIKIIENDVPVKPPRPPPPPT